MVAPASSLPLQGNAQTHARVPLIINNIAIHDNSDKNYYTLADSTESLAATVDHAQRAAESSAQAFQEWSRTSPLEQLQLLFHLAQIREQPSI